MRTAASTPPGTWLAAARADTKRAPLVARIPLYAGAHEIGSVEAFVLERVVAEKGAAQALGLSLQEGAWHLAVDDHQLVSDALNALASALRRVGCSGPWRNEQLAVCNAAGERIGTIERGAVRPLGIQTSAVHLVGYAVSGDIWVQQRAFDKPNNPGMWDTLMGGMVSAADTLEQALERETWEEAGLRIAELKSLRHGGHVDFSQPAEEEDNGGYMRERIDWFECCIPEGLVPDNQDGEVERFECLPRAEVEARLARGEFTPEAALILAAYFNW